MLGFIFIKEKLFFKRKDESSTDITSDSEYCASRLSQHLMRRSVSYDFQVLSLSPHGPCVGSFHYTQVVYNNVTGFKKIRFHPTAIMLKGLWKPFIPSTVEQSVYSAHRRCLKSFIPMSTAMVLKRISQANLGKLGFSLFPEPIRGSKSSIFSLIIFAHQK